MALRLRSTASKPMGKIGTSQENAVPLSRMKQDGRSTLTGKPSATGLGTKPATRRAALGEIGNRTSNIPVSSASNTVLKKEQFAKPSFAASGAATKPGPVVRSTRTTQVRQSLVCKTSTLVKPSVAVPVTSRAATISRSTTSVSNRILQGISSTSKARPTFAITHPVYAPVVPKDSGIRDFDREAYNNPVLLGLYCGEIYAYLREIEVKFLVEDNFLKEKQVTPKMRAMVVDWLVDVQQQYNLLLETLHLSVGIFDRFLEKCSTVTRQKLQLAGVTSLWIAAKYEELFSPELENFVYITDQAYTKTEILQMEQLIHTTLDFSYGQPLSIHFLRRFSNACEAQPKHHVFAKYFLELTLLEYNFRHIKPSLIAAVAIYVSFCIVGEHGKPGRHIWSNTLSFYTTYSFDDIIPLVSTLASLILDAKDSRLQAIQKKYASVRQMRVSTTTEQKTEILEDLARNVME